MQYPEKPVKIAEGIHWVGALNPELKRFDVVMETKYGTSYNSYLVQGEKKTVLIDSVKDGFLSQSEALIRQLVDPATIDYIIVQHTEPDHSGSLAQMLKLAPRARILCSKPASLYLPHIANAELPLDPVKDGDTLDLGGRTLTFYMAPFLHWPDTMFTYDSKAGALFTCDAFGFHFSPEHVLESLTPEPLEEARRYYYDCIMAPFAPHVAKAVEKLDGLKLNINAILPSHGPALDKNPMKAVDLYRTWSHEQPPHTGRKVFVGYVSCYAYTRALADKLAAQLTARGAEVELQDVSLIDPAEAARRIHAADALAIGSPTLCADAMPPVWATLTHVLAPIVRGRPAVAFGSYGWSGEAVPMLDQRLTGLGFQVAGTFRHRFRPNQEAFDEMSALADKLADKMKL